jgi:hypothetical protein
MRLWLDDVRPMPNDFVCHCLRAKEAINFVRMGMVSHISFDHDLGEPENGTGYDVAKVIEEGAFDGTIPPMTWAIHSANPVGRKNIEVAMKNAERYWGSARNSIKSV